MCIFGYMTWWWLFYWRVEYLREIDNELLCLDLLWRLIERYSSFTSILLLWLVCFQVNWRMKFRHHFLWEMTDWANFLQVEKILQFLLMKVEQAILAFFKVLSVTRSNETLRNIVISELFLYMLKWIYKSSRYIKKERSETSTKLILGIINQTYANWHNGRHPLHFKRRTANL